MVYQMQRKWHHLWAFYSLSMLVSFRGGGGGSSGGGVCFRVTRAKSHFTIFTWSKSNWREFSAWNCLWVNCVCHSANDQWFVKWNVVACLRRVNPCSSPLNEFYDVLTPRERDKRALSHLTNTLSLYRRKIWQLHSLLSFLFLVVYMRDKTFFVR